MSESQETPEPRDLRRVHIEGSARPHSLCQGTVDFGTECRGLGPGPQETGPRGSPSTGHVECATLGTKAFAF